MNEATKAVSDVVSGSARLGYGWGVATMIFGGLAILVPFFTGVAVTGIVAVLLVAAGLTQSVFAFKAGSLGQGIMQFLFGGLAIVCGVAMFIWPLMGLASLTMVITAYLLADGVFGIVAGFQMKPTQGWGWMVVSGISSVALAGFLLWDWPFSGQYAIGVLLGVRLMFSGWSMIMLGAVGEAASDEIRSAA